MPKSAPPGAPPRAPTPYEPLNDLLATFVERVRALLGENFVGAYLQGSFALGDFDDDSDVDFLVVTRRDIAPAEQPALRAMHAELHAASPPWSQRLEGSYFPAAILRRPSATPRDPPEEPRGEDWADDGASGGPPKVYPLLFIGNGEHRLVRSEHDNAQVVRWIAREHGVTLAGPPLRALIDPVSPDALRASVREQFRFCAERHVAAETITRFWQQAFWVTLYCRMLHCLELGRMTSKKAAAAWAMQTLDPRWRGLIERALASRPAPEETQAGPADPAAVAETVAFVQYALALDAARPAAATPADRARSILEQKLARTQATPGGRPQPSWGPQTARGPGRGGWTPPPTRPGGRGRRG